MMKQILIAAMFAFSAAACSTDECADAADRLEECGATDESGVDLSQDECSGNTACFAACINDAECADLNSDDANNSYNQCNSACLE